MSNKIICGSFDEHKGYYINQHYDKKLVLQVKIIKIDDNDESEKLEEKINLFLINSQIILVISSPSNSTTGFFTLILLTYIIYLIN